MIGNVSRLAAFFLGPPSVYFAHAGIPITAGTPVKRLLASCFPGGNVRKSAISVVFRFPSSEGTHHSPVAISRIWGTGAVSPAKPSVAG